MPVVTTTVPLMFIRAGISEKNKRPYICVSNGRKEFYLNIPKGMDLDINDFSKLIEGELVDMEVSLIVGNESVSFVSLK